MLTLCYYRGGAAAQRDIARKRLSGPAGAAQPSGLVHGLCEEARIESGIQPVTDFGGSGRHAHAKINIYPDSSIVRKTACHGAISGFVMGHDLRRLFVSR
jgi:hypothetical protein